MTAMALLLKPADTPRLGILLNRRLIRMIVAAAVILFTVAVFLWRQDHFVAILPVLGWKGRPKSSEFYTYPTASDFFPVSINPTNKSTKDLCATFPKHMLNLVQPVLKMGHGEDRAKIEAQLDSVSACFEPGEILIFSDLDETIRKHNVIDILANLPPSYYNQADNPDIRHYLLQKEMRDQGILHTDAEAAKRINGWTIDKFKFLPGVEKAWIFKPDKPFYFFFETDTYVFWDNLFRFLQTFNPDKPIYMGSPSPGQKDPRKDNIQTWFANGGPGYVLSRGAMKSLIHRNTSRNGQYIEPSLTEKWLPLLRHECCGDSVMGWALWNISIPLQGYWPMFNAHPLHGIPFNQMSWCQPVLTLHKTTPKDMVDVWRWEFGQRKYEKPLLYSDLWNFHHPGKPSILENWDNGEWDGWNPPPEAKIDSFEKCGELCKKEESCVQWSWRGKDGKKCVLMRSIRYGMERKPEPILTDQERKQLKGQPPPKDAKWIDFKAGWVEDRVERWRRERQCEVAEWVGPSITRIF